MKIESRNKLGFSLVTVMGIMAVLSITFTMLLKMGQQGAFTGKLLRDRTKATAYAEAGIEFAYSILRADYENRNNPALFRIDTSQAYTVGDTLTSTYGEGDFSLHISNMNDGQYVIINSVGTCGKSSAEAEAMVEDTNYGPENPMEAFTKAIAGGGSGKFAGGGAAVGNPELIIHLNGPVVVNGSMAVEVSLNSSEEIDLKNKTINGEATAPVVEGNPGTVTETETAVATIATPIIDLSKFYNKADVIYTGKTRLKSDMSGIIFVDGDVTISAHITGTVIATGNIKIVAGGGIVENGEGIAAATGTGNISYGSNGDSEGLFYSRTGDFSQTAGDGIITGQIIVGGDVDKTGGGTLIFEVNVPDEIYNEANPVIAGWQK